MIVVRVELWSAVNGEKTELARMVVDNIGGTTARGNYRCRTLKGRSKAALDGALCAAIRGGKGIQRESQVIGHARLREHVWNLVAKCLTAMDYGDRSELERMGGAR